MDIKAISVGVVLALIVFGFVVNAAYRATLGIFSVIFWLGILTAVAYFIVGDTMGFWAYFLTEIVLMVGLVAVRAVVRK